MRKLILAFLSVLLPATNLVAVPYSDYFRESKFRHKRPAKRITAPTKKQPEKKPSKKHGMSSAIKKDVIAGSLVVGALIIVTVIALYLKYKIAKDEPVARRNFLESAREEFAKLQDYKELSKTGLAKKFNEVDSRIANALGNENISQDDVDSVLRGLIEPINEITGQTLTLDDFKEKPHEALKNLNLFVKKKFLEPLARRYGLTDVSELADLKVKLAARVMRKYDINAEDLKFAEEGDRFSSFIEFRFSKKTGRFELSVDLTKAKLANDSPLTVQNLKTKLGISRTSGSKDLTPRELGVEIRVGGVSVKVAKKEQLQAHYTERAINLLMDKNVRIGEYVKYTFEGAERWAKVTRTGLEPVSEEDGLRDYNDGYPVNELGDLPDDFVW